MIELERLIPSTGTFFVSLDATESIESRSVISGQGGVISFYFDNHWYYHVYLPYMDQSRADVNAPRCFP